jgi:CBS domain-containing protein
LLRSKGFDVITVRPTTTVSEALALLKEYNLGAVVVSTDGKDISGTPGNRSLNADGHVVPLVPEVPPALILASGWRCWRRNADCCSTLR